MCVSVELGLESTDTPLDSHYLPCTIHTSADINYVSNLFAIPQPEVAKIDTGGDLVVGAGIWKARASD